MKDNAYELAKVSPPVGVSSLTIMGAPVDQIVLVLTLVYTAILLVDKLFPAVLPAFRRWVLRVLKGGR